MPDTDTIQYIETRYGTVSQHRVELMIAVLSNISRSAWNVGRDDDELVSVEDYAGEAVEGLTIRWQSRHSPSASRSSLTVSRCSIPSSRA